MRQTILRAGIIVAVVSVAVASMPGAQGASPRVAAATHWMLRSGRYRVHLASKAGFLVVAAHGSDRGLALSEVASSRATNVLAHVGRAVENSGGDSVLLIGTTSWCRFKLRVTFRDTILHLKLDMKASGSAPLSPVQPDATPIRLPSLRLYPEKLDEYSAATPVAGSSVYIGDPGMRTSVLYSEDYTALGSYFQATNSDPTQGSFLYPGASTSSAVGVSGSRFGYELPGAGLLSMPLNRWLPVIDSYLAFGRLPNGQSQTAEQYLVETDHVLRIRKQPIEPAVDWHRIAASEIANLGSGQNWDSLTGHHYLKSYVSDERVEPELITQLSVLVGLRQFLNRVAGTHPAAVRMAKKLDGDLPQFFDGACHSMTNSISSGGFATEESWYYLTNLISLLKLAQLGDQIARHELLMSVGTAVKLAHRVHYRFPMTINCPDLSTSGALQKDVAGGYAFLMLGVNGLTHKGRYLTEARDAIHALFGSGFSLSYELHMTAYGAAAAESLYKHYRWPVYRRAASVTLANFFASVRLWDCTYGTCAGGGYHTYMGVNPLPWSDYIATREQYESWLGLSAFLKAAVSPGGKPQPGLIDLARRFVSATPLTMQYALPTKLPHAAETDTPRQYSFVMKNRLDWDIPLEDLRTGLTTSGTIGQEIYGAGGPLIFAAAAG